MKHATGLRRIATTLYITLPTLANAILVFSLFIFMFSVLGTQLFYGGHAQLEEWLCPQPGSVVLLAGGAPAKL